MLRGRGLRGIDIGGSLKMSDPPGSGGMKMKQETELVSKEDGVSAEFKQKMSAWEQSGVFDKMAQEIDVGRFGCFNFEQGIYWYVGSAQKNLSARLERHSRKRKPLHWHIDYLSVKAQMLGSIVIPGSGRHECQLARKFAEMFQLAVDGFGASDCRCEGHLFYSGKTI